MASGRKKAVVGTSIGAGAIAAGAGAVAVARRGGKPAAAHPEGTHPWGYTPDRVEAAVATDGTVLPVEIDEPKGSTRAGRPTVVLAHGFTLDLTAWAKLRARLVLEGYRVVCYDQRNHGLSGMGDHDHCTIEQLGRDLKAVLDAFAPEGPVVLVGHSMGGMTIMSLTGQYPDYVRERVQSVALVSTSAGGMGLVSVGFGKILDLFVVRFGPGLLRGLSARRTMWQGVRRVGREAEKAAVQRYGFGRKADDETLEHFSDIIFGTPLETTAAFLPHLDDLDVREALPGLAHTEVLVIGGSRDELTPPSHSDEIVERVPHSAHVVVPKAGHLLPMERPEVVADEVVELIERGIAAATRRARRKPTSETVVRDTGDAVEESA